jgi:hypothetical protein
LEKELKNYSVYDINIEINTKHKILFFPNRFCAA